MTTFPSYYPVYSAPKQTQSSTRIFALGDGYGSSVSFGLNSTASEWQLSWEVPGSIASEIDGFLEEQGNNGDAFEWQPPDANIPLRWRCDEWSVEQHSYDLFRISATFRKVFELVVPGITAASAVCESDVLCEGDYGDLGADLWISRITAPFSTIDFQNPANTGWPSGHSVVADNMGRSYTVWIAKGPSGATNSLVITKRNPNGEIIWSREIADAILVSIYKVLIADVGDGSESLLVFGQWAAFGGYDQIYIFSLSGEFRRGFNITNCGGTQAHCDGMIFAPRKKHLIIMRHDAQTPTFDVIDPIYGSYIAGWNMNVQGSIYASGDIPSGDASLVEFDDNTSAICYNIGGGRIFVASLTENYTPSTSVKQYLYSGSGCVATRYGDGFIVAGGSKIYKFNKYSELEKVIIHDEGTPSQLYVGTDAVYMGTTTFARSVKYNYELTTKITRNIAAIFNNTGWINWAGTHNADESLCIPVNRFVASNDTLQGYGASAPGGSALFQVIGIRASAVGGFTNMYAGGNTASAQGFNINSTMPTYLASAGPVANVWTYWDSTLNLSNRNGTVTVSQFIYKTTDATDKYKFTLYSTDLVA